MIRPCNSSQSCAFQSCDGRDALAVRKKKKNGQQLQLYSPRFIFSFFSKGMFQFFYSLLLQLQTPFFSELFYSDKGFGQMLTFPPNNFYLKFAGAAEYVSHSSNYHGTLQKANSQELLQFSVSWLHFTDGST